MSSAPEIRNRTLTELGEEKSDFKSWESNLLLLARDSYFSLENPRLTRPGRRVEAISCHLLRVAS